VFQKIQRNTVVVVLMFSAFLGKIGISFLPILTLCNRAVLIEISKKKKFLCLSDSRNDVVCQCICIYIVIMCIHIYSDGLPKLWYEVIHILLYVTLFSFSDFMLSSIIHLF
jgi:hypothetical protein